MAITRWQGIVFCWKCSRTEKVYWLEAANMARHIESLPHGWIVENGVYICGDHEAPEVEVKIEVPTRSIPRHVTGAAPESESIEEETDGS